MKAVSKMVFFTAFLFAFTQPLLIREVSEDEIQNMLIYKAKLSVSPYRNEEKIRSPEVQNYTPVKFHLIGEPHIELSYSVAENRRKRKA